MGNDLFHVKPLQDGGYAVMDRIGESVELIAGDRETADREADRLNRSHYERLQEYFRGYAEDFAKWRAARPGEVFDTPEEAGIETSLKVGDKVTFTNGYGARFPGHRVLGFCRRDRWGQCVFLDYDCYWLPARLEELSKYPFYYIFFRGIRKYMG